jgi:hypothetical protein
MRGVADEGFDELRKTARTMSRNPFPIPSRDPLLLHGRWQAPVGQGGFHIGGIHLCAGPLAGRESVYVYDCGSIPKRHAQGVIARLRAGAWFDTIDVLMLSHFDIDHICGVPDLLAGPPRGVGVDTIVMPYVDMDERILSLARAAAGDRDIDDFMMRMVDDPQAALSAFRPRRIVFVLADDDDPPEGPGFEPVGPTPLGGDIEGIAWTLDAIGPGIRAWRRFLHGARSDRTGAVEHVVARNAALLARDPCGAELWKLRSYVKRADPRRLEAFRKRIEHAFGWSRGDFRAKVRDPAVRREMATAKRTAVARAYRTAFGDKNLTSLCVYSGPSDLHCAQALAPHQDGRFATKIGWMGTGDADLRDPRALAEFRRAYGADLGRVATFLLPHHGSIENSDPTDPACDARTWVAAAEPGNPRWRHPHPRLRDAVTKRGEIFRQVKSAPDHGHSETFWLFAGPTTP